jgi:ribonuclease HII
VTRDRIMVELHESYPAYDFVTHKGYITPTHAAALDEHGPCEIHRQRFVNVRRAQGEPVRDHRDDLGNNDLDGLVHESMEAESMEIGR